MNRSAVHLSFPLDPDYFLRFESICGEIIISAEEWKLTLQRMHDLHSTQRLQSRWLRSLLAPPRTSFSFVRSRRALISRTWMNRKSDHIISTQVQDPRHGQLPCSPRQGGFDNLKDHEGGGSKILHPEWKRNVFPIQTSLFFITSLLMITYCCINHLGYSNVFARDGQARSLDPK